jgi:hypothetical protein
MTLRLLNVHGPFGMIFHWIDTQADDLRATLVELWLQPGHIAQLGRANRGEVLGMREEDRPAIPNPTVEITVPGVVWAVKFGASELILSDIGSFLSVVWLRYCGVAVWPVCSERRSADKGAKAADWRKALWVGTGLRAFGQRNDLVGRNLPSGGRPIKNAVVVVVSQ